MVGEYHILRDGRLSRAKALIAGNKLIIPVVTVYTCRYAG
jgi:hypothetical protein